MTDGGGWERIRAMPFPELREDQLRAICERHGFPPGPFGRLPSTGVVNAIYTVGDDVVLRIPKNTAGALADTYTESVAVPAAMAAGVRTPALLAFDESFDVVDVPFGAYEWVHAPDGWPAADEGWRGLGRDLATLHTGVTSCPDPLGRLDTPGRWCHADRMLDALTVIDDADCRRSLHAAFRRLELAVQEWEETGTPHLLHDDVKASNLLQRDGAYVAIIDWGDAGWGDAAIDFRNLPPARTAEVLAGYRQVTEVDDAFEERIRWDQLGAAARRYAEPEQRDLLRVMIASP